MFSLLYGLLDYLFRKDEHRILVVGLDASGKTTFIEKLKSLYTSIEGLSPEKIRPTVGLNVARFEAFNSSLIFWDLGGAANLRPLWEKYYNEAHGVVFVIDSADKSRFEEAKSTLDRVLGSRELARCPLLILCNKMDKAEAEKREEILEHLGFRKMEPTQPFHALSICAVDGGGIPDAVEWIVQTIKVNQRTMRN